MDSILAKQGLWKIAISMRFSLMPTRGLQIRIVLKSQSRIYLTHGHSIQFCDSMLFLQPHASILEPDFDLAFR